MDVVKDMSIITDAKLVLAQAERTQDPKAQRVLGLDAYYLLLITNGCLPGSTATFPNRALTRELHTDMVTRVPDLAFTALRSLGIFFGQQRFRNLGIRPWRHMTGNGWTFPRLITLRQNWELDQAGWRWPNGHQNWVWNR